MVSSSCLLDGPAPAPAPDKVQAVSCVIGGDSNMNLADYVSGIVSFSPAETVALDRQFPNNASKKRCNARPIAGSFSAVCVMTAEFGWSSNEMCRRRSRMGLDTSLHLVEELEACMEEHMHRR